MKLPKNYHPDFRVPGKKPVGPVEIDRKNTFGRSVILCAGDSGSLKTKGSKTGFYWSTTHPTQHVGRTENDIYFYADHGGSDDDTLTTTEQLPTTRSISKNPRQTLLLQLVPERAGYDLQRILNVDETLGFYLIIHYSSSVSIGYQGGNGFQYSYQFPISEWKEGVVNTVAISIDSISQEVNVNLNGLTNSDATGITGNTSYIGGGSIAATDTFSLSNAGYTNYYGYKGKVKLASLLHDSYSEGQLQALAKDPYQILKPANPIHLPIQVSGGGGPTPVTADLTAQWNLLQAVQSDANLQWSLLNAVQQSADLQWSILNSVQQDADLQWSIIQAVQQDADIRWDIQAALSAVQNDLTAQWSVLQSVFADADARWSILNSVFNDSDLRWSILNSVLSDADLRWDILSALSGVSSDLELRWDMSGKVFSSLTAQWDIFNAVTSDADLKWSILNAISQDLSSQWDVVEAIQAGADLRWDIVAATDSTLTLRWNIASETQFPDLEGVITLESKTPVFTVSSLTPKITVH